MGSRAKLNMTSFLLVALFSTDSIFITYDLYLDLRFVLILNYKHVRTAGLSVKSARNIFFFVSIKLHLDSYSNFLHGNQCFFVNVLLRTKKRLIEGNAKCSNLKKLTYKKELCGKCLSV